MFINYDNLNISFIQTKPYCIFKINNFYSYPGYTELLNNFPRINDGAKKYIEEYNNKFYFNSDSKFYKKLISENRVLKEFHNNIFNKKLIYFFYKKLYFYFLCARKKDINKIFRLLKIPKFECEYYFEKNFSSYFFNKIRPIIEFSYINNFGKVVPHTDNKIKLLSMLTYFPEKDEDLESSLKKGTKFWLSKIKNYENVHLKDELEEKFIKESKLIYDTPFDKMTLYGFIKNEYSWHSVTQIKIPNNQSRKSINISLIIDK